MLIDQPQATSRFTDHLQLCLLVEVKNARLEVVHLTQDERLVKVIGRLKVKCASYSADFRYQERLS